jgi:alpha-1,3-rhamnosyl/mannosyltransferase
MPEIADGAARLVDPTNVDAIADGLLEVLSDKTRHGELREAGLRRAAQFSWRTVAERTVEVYEMVTKKKAAA